LAVEHIILAAPQAAITEWRNSGPAEGPNECGYFTAGIDVPTTDIFGRPTWHYHAIEFHSKDKEEAERRRDVALDLFLHRADPDWNNSYTMIGLAPTAPDFLVKAARAAHRQSNLKLQSEHGRELAATIEAAFDAIYKQRGINP
jgi:hypothetical protein